MFAKITINNAARAFFREFFLLTSADPVEPCRMRTAAVVRLLLIVPTIFLITFISIYEVRGAGHAPEAQEFVFIAWSLLTLTYITGNMILFFLPDEMAGIMRRLTGLSIFFELSTNQLILYLLGALISPQTLFIVVVIAAYRVFMNYGFALFATLTGAGLYALVATLELTGMIPLSPALPYMVIHPIYADAFVGVNIVVGVVSGIIFAFFSINYGMNQTLKLQKQLRDQSLLDGLTGIANRRRFNEYLELEWNRALRNKKPLSLVLLDIDMFKPYNDNYGHAAGDECLKKVARALQENLKRPTDLVARFGGEEFAVILADTDAAGAAAMAGKLRQKIETLNIAHAHSPVCDKITASLGAASLVPDEKTSVDTLIDLADKALYRAKRAGRNRVVSAPR